MDIVNSIKCKQMDLLNIGNSKANKSMVIFWILSLYLILYSVNMQIIMEDLTVKGKFGILSLLFEAYKIKKTKFIALTFCCSSY